MAVGMEAMDTARGRLPAMIGSRAAGAYWEFWRGGWGWNTAPLPCGGVRVQAVASGETMEPADHRTCCPMDVLARIPELPPTRAPATARPVGGPGSHAAATTQPRAIHRSRRGRSPRIPNASLVVLALIAAAVWSVVAWREKDRLDDEREAIRMARQTEGWSSSLERMR